MKLDLSKFNLKKKDDTITVKPTAEERRREKLKRQKERHDNEKISLVRFTYDADHDEYIYDERTMVARMDLPHDAVHITGRKQKYLWTDIWDELIWPEKGQSAIHMYLWMINEKISPDTLSEKKSKIYDIDWQKVLMIGAIAVAAILIVPKFIH